MLRTRRPTQRENNYFGSTEVYILKMTLNRLKCILIQTGNFYCPSILIIQRIKLQRMDKIKFFYILLTFIDKSFIQNVQLTEAFLPL